MFPKLLLSGDWKTAGEMSLALLQAGFRLEFAPVSLLDVQEPVLGLAPLLVAVSDKKDFPAPGSQWLAWLQRNDPSLTILSYQAGARAVFPPDIPPDLLIQALLQLSGESEYAERAGFRWQVQRGDPIFLEPDSVLSIHEGVLSTMMIHGDGAEVLLGLTGPGQMLVAHPDDECFIQILAHTTAVVSLQTWEQACATPGFAAKLRIRLQQMEAWAAMQARPYLDQRILGILSLLAEQFGAPHPDGILINVRLTHAQLAAAVGATRTTITRVLGELRALGKISLDESSKRELFILRRGIELHHH